MRIFFFVAIGLVINSSFMIAAAETSDNKVATSERGCGVNGVSPGVPEDTHYLYLSPDRYEGLQRVGILKISKDGNAILNPPKPYPDSFPLKGLTLAEARRLWTSGRDSNLGNYKTFALWGIWAVDKREKTLYHIDAKFIDGKLAAYRVRGSGLKADWIAN